MPFRLPNKCRSYFANIVDRADEAKLDTLFDEYYLCALVGLAQGKFNGNPDLGGEFMDYYPSDYAESGDYIAGLLICAEAKRRSVPIDNANSLERLMTELLSAHSRTRLSENGENCLNKYADRGIEIIRERMAGPHMTLEDFLQDYFECWEQGVFLE